MLAITARYGDKPDNGVYYVDKEFKDIFDKLGVSLFPVSSLMSLYDVVNLCQGLIVTGSPIDINPMRYGSSGKNVHPMADETDTLDFTYIQAFHSVGKPVLGICRGIQSINVCFGGTLKSVFGHRLDTPVQNAVLHDINLSKGSLLRSWYDDRDIIPVNSLHSLAVDKVADGFEIIAKSVQNNVTEAIFRDNILGVQWHPEYMDDIFFFAKAVEWMKEVYCNSLRKERVTKG